MDEKDLAIIEELQTFRRRFTEIARKLGISEAAVRKRVKKMLEQGIIKGGVDIDWLKLGELFLVIVEPEEERFYEVGKKLIESKPVMLFSAYPRFIGLFRKVPEVDAKLEVIRLLERIV